MKKCTQCKSEFIVTDVDREFYKEVSPLITGKIYLIPEPTLCPDCRYQKRLSLRNERKLYRRICDATGENVVSIFSPDKKSPPVYSQKYWWSDEWDPKKYGREFDFSRSFFEQFKELYNEVPQIALNNSKSENCEYTNQSQENKNSYFLISSGKNEECYYSMWLQHSHLVMDSLYMMNSELCYEVINGERCHSCTFSDMLENCSNCHFSYNLIGCSDCVGCVNLRNKKHHIFNEPYSPEEYEKKVKELKLDTVSGIRVMKEKMKDFRLKFPQKYYKGSQLENSTGDNIYEMKDSNHCFNCRYCEDVSYSQDVWKARNCRGMTETIENDFCYSIEGCAFTSNCLFSAKINYVSNILYSSHIYSSHFLFGCVSMKNARYCILNKQYSREEYEELVPKIIEHMRETGEWGKHFSPNISHFGYNESVAQEYFPLTKEQAVDRGWHWFDEKPVQLDAIKKIPAEQLPESIADIPDDILNWAIECEATGRPFKIIPQELTLYRQMNLPVPRLHPDERHRRRMALRNPRGLWKRGCGKCRTSIQSSYPLYSPEMVYCEECYLGEVY